MELFVRIDLLGLSSVDNWSRLFCALANNERLRSHLRDVAPALYLLSPSYNLAWKAALLDGSSYLYLSADFCCELLLHLANLCKMRGSLWNGGCANFLFWQDVLSMLCELSAAMNMAYSRR